MQCFKPTFNFRILNKYGPRNREAHTQPQNQCASNGGCVPPQPIITNKHFQHATFDFRWLFYCIMFVAFIATFHRYLGLSEMSAIGVV